MLHGIGSRYLIYNLPLGGGAKSQQELERELERRACATSARGRLRLASAVRQQPSRSEPSARSGRRAGSVQGRDLQKPGMLPEAVPARVERFAVRAWARYTGEGGLNAQLRAGRVEGCFSEPARKKGGML